MKLKKSVKLMQKLLQSPHALKAIELTKDDYEKEKKNIKTVHALIGGDVNLLYGVPVRCNPEHSESMFLVALPDVLIAEHGGIMKEYSYAYHYVLADLSYMEGIKDKIT